MVNFKNSLCGVGCLYATVNETRGDWICQKLQKIWDSPYLKADLTQFHKNWYKKQGSWVKDEGQWLTSIVVARELAFLSLVPWTPISTGQIKKGQITPVQEMACVPEKEPESFTMSSCPLL